MIVSNRYGKDAYLVSEDLINEQILSLLLSDHEKNKYLIKVTETNTDFVAVDADNIEDAKKIAIKNANLKHESVVAEVKNQK